MKSSHALFFLSNILILGGLLAGCTKEADLPEPFLSIQAEPPVFGSDGGSDELKFKTNRSWSIAPDTIPADEWCRITPTSGDGGEELSVMISVDPNEEYIARSLCWCCAAVRSKNASRSRR